MPAPRRILLPVGVFLATLVTFAACGSADRGTRSQARAAQAAPARPGTITTLTLGSGAGARPYVVYTPAGWRATRHMPLIVLLHGCNATAYQQLEASNYDPLADRSGFVVLYPEVTQAEATKPGFSAYCWNDMDRADWTRGTGDPAAIVAQTRRVISAWSIDPKRVYLAGMSSGAYLAADMAASYPDVFAAVAQDAGGAYADNGCGESPTSSLSVSQSAAMAYREMGRRARVVPRLVIGGDADPSVAPACATKALLQALRTDNLVLDHRQTSPIGLSPRSVTAGTAPGGDGYTVSTYVTAGGCVVGQRWLVKGMKHFWSGGSSDPRWAQWTDPAGPSAAAASWAFFSRYSLVRPVC